MKVEKKKDDIFDSDILDYTWTEDRTNENNYWKFITVLVAFVAKIADVKSVTTYGEIELDYTIDEYHHFESADDFAKRNEEAKDDAQTVEISFDFKGEHINMTVYVNNAKFGNAILSCFIWNEAIGDKFSDLLLERFK